jgi:hypothetical protein
VTCSTFDLPLRTPPMVLPFRLSFCAVLGSCFPSSPSSVSATDLMISVALVLSFPRTLGRLLDQFPFGRAH